MNKLFDKFGKKKVIAFACGLLAILAVAVVLVCIFASKGLKNVSVPKSAGYASIVSAKNLSEQSADKALADYSKSESDNSATYTKDGETIHIKTDSNGKVVYKSYEKEMGSKEQSKISGFKESKIKIGMAESKVLSLLKNNNYIYNLITTDNSGKVLHIYYYGWTGNKAALELVFTAGKLSYYTINSADLVSQVNPPEVK